MSDFSIRAAASADAPLVVSLLRELADYEDLLDGFALTEDWVRRDMLGSACHCDLAFAAHEPAGIVTWFWTYGSFRAARALYVEDLYVRPDFRGRGLGRRLLALLAGKARQAGGILQWQVLDWNTPSIEFYKSLGAVLMPEWVNCRLQGEALERFAAPGEKL
jgi:GNAT superfamily N-acetyltransferase